MQGSCLEKLFNRGVIMNLATDSFDLNRFVVAQKQDYAVVVNLGLQLTYEKTTNNPSDLIPI